MTRLPIAALPPFWRRALLDKVTYPTYKETLKPRRAGDLNGEEARRQEVLNDVGGARKGGRP